MDAKPYCPACAAYYESAPGNVKECLGCGSLTHRILEGYKPKAKSTAVKDAKARRDAKQTANLRTHMLPPRVDYLTSHECAGCFFEKIALLNGRACVECTPLLGKYHEPV
jgi:hypothetical protein